jgi:hypothetical protein
MTITPARPKLLSETDIARNTYDEAVRVTEAYRIQLHARRRAVHSDPAERERRIDEAVAQMEAAERAEYAAWQQLEHLRQMAIRQPWATV